MIKCKQCENEIKEEDQVIIDYHNKRIRLCIGCYNKDEIPKFKEE